MVANSVLRVGIVVDGSEAPAWIGALIARVKKSEYAALTQVFFAPSPRRHPSLFQLLYGAIDRLFFPLQDDALATASLADMLAGIPAQDICSKDDWQSADKSLAQLDLLLHLSSGPAPEGLTHACDIWFYDPAMRRNDAGLN